MKTTQLVPYYRPVATYALFLLIELASILARTVFVSNLPLCAVSMILAIAYDIKIFVLILGMTLVGFALGFWMLSYPDLSLPFGTLQGALLNVFAYMLGNFDTDFSGTAVPAVALMLLVVFMMFMVVLMLNLLIALMGKCCVYVCSTRLLCPTFIS